MTAANTSRSHHTTQLAEQCLLQCQACKLLQTAAQMLWQGQALLLHREVLLLLLCCQ
jgi:hypothetical protein